MQQVEICRVLHRNAQIIILDEPTSILSEHEIQSLFNTLKILKQEGKSIIFITHKLPEIKQIGDRAAVLRKGELAALCDIKNIDEYEIARLMIGSQEETVKKDFQFSERQEQNTEKNNQPVISFKDVTVTRRGQKTPLLDKVSFSLNKCEILGFAAVTGNGLGVIEAVLGGFIHPSSGKIIHKSKDITALNTRQLRNMGLAYVPADRLRVGSALDATIIENMIINHRHELSRGMIINKKEALEFSNELAASYNIEGADTGKKCFSLSGGNLQKMILAREIKRLKDYIVFSEPTWGLDIASSNFILKQIDSLREKGAAVILISTNLDEILALADRIIVMYRGRIAGEFANNGDASIKEAVGNCMQGLGAEE